MRWICLVAWTIALLAPAFAAAGLFDRKPKVNPQARVPELLATLASAKSADERARAAEELREFDAAAFPEIVPNLIVALQKDDSSTVRREAAQSLGRIRPTSAEALQALELAADKDDNALVRLQARTAKLGYKAPVAKKPDGGVIISVPPPGPDGRIKPVPLPSPPVVETPRPIKGNEPIQVPPPQPLPTPIVSPGPKLEPPVAPVKLPSDPQPDKNQGPILIPPKP